MVCGGFSLARNWPARRLMFGALFLCVMASLPAPAAPQADSDIPPDATPQVHQISPNQAVAGAHMTVVLVGSNFATGAYVSSVSGAIQVESSKRLSATQMEAQLSVSPSARPGMVSLLVSNPASRTAEAAFEIVAGEAPSAPASAPGVEPSNPAAPGAPAPPATEDKPSAPAMPPAPGNPATPPGPEVTAIEPPQVSPGFNVDLKITGKNFLPGANVSFANPGIRVLGITSPSSTELSVYIKVTRDAVPGIASLFVVNPDDNEVEAPFEVTAKVAKPTAAHSPAPPPVPDSPDTQRYAAFHLGSPAEAFQTHGKIKGALVVASGTIQYQEDGKVLINIAMSEIKEIRVSSVATATFHITLTSGKAYHFAPGSWRPSDARTLADSLRAALPHDAATR